MRFLVDDQLPAALARWLAANGHEAAHVMDIGLTGATDRVIWEQARRTGAVIETKDEDFLNLQKQLPGPSVVWLTMGNCKKSVLLDRFERRMPEILKAIEAGETLVELR